MSDKAGPREVAAPPTTIALRSKEPRESDKAIASLYYTIASQRVRNNPVVLQFVAAGANAGTSLVASQFATFAAQFHNGGALLIDCAPPQWGGKLLPAATAARPSLFASLATTGGIEAAVEPASGVVGLHFARLNAAADPAMDDGTDAVEALLDAARRKFQFTALDSPAIDESPIGLTFLRACDGVVLVVEADKTTSSSAEAAVELIERCGGKVLGLVFNKRRHYMPRWLYRRL